MKYRQTCLFQAREENDRNPGSLFKNAFEEDRKPIVKDKSPDDRSAMSLKNLIEEEKQNQR